MENFYKKPKLVKPKPKQNDFWKPFSNPKLLNDPKVFEKFSQDVYNKINQGVKPKMSDYHFDRFKDFESFKQDYLDQGGDRSSYMEELVGEFALPKGRRGNEIFEQFEEVFQGSDKRDKFGDYLRQFDLQFAEQMYKQYIADKSKKKKVK
jgi:hypothetical protein